MDTKLMPIAAGLLLCGSALADLTDLVPEAVLKQIAEELRAKRRSETSTQSRCITHAGQHAIR